jgi:hypothetical protein
VGEWHGTYRADSVRDDLDLEVGHYVWMLGRWMKGGKRENKGRNTRGEKKGSWAAVGLLSLGDWTRLRTVGCL